ncbi:MAG: hypothetical protein GEU28_02820 [Dehalococcoidia bacterium]|nr:hypothetical protein [Dehalococcoidia bacterium]
MTAAVSRAMHMALVNASVEPDVVLVDGKMLINTEPRDAVPASLRVNGPPNPYLASSGPAFELTNDLPTATARRSNGHDVQAHLLDMGQEHRPAGRNGTAYRQQAIVDGDALCMSIAAASIVAKVARDHMMEVLHHEYPCYGWRENKGYATPEHKQAIRQHGASPWHRMLFAPVRLAAQGVLL